VSYTIVLTEEEKARRFENQLNRAFRRCRIVNAKSKPGRGVGPFDLPIASPFATFSPWQEVPETCKSCVGKACGNAACPMRMLAISGRVEAFDATAKITPLYDALRI